MKLEADSSIRARFGVVVTLVELDDGATRLVIDDVRADKPQRETSWAFDCFYTHKRLDSKLLKGMALPADEYQGLGEAIIARLIALNGIGHR